jgi:endo-1,4-beta-D-glucanase Y
MIVLFHTNENMPRELQLDIMHGFGEDGAESHALKVAEAFKAGHYFAVAVGNTDSLDDMYRWTQNGVVTDSWCLKPLLDKWLPIYPAFHMHNGQKYGRRSSMVGDVFNHNGEYYTCSTFGFTRLNLV